MSLLTSNVATRIVACSRLSWMLWLVVTASLNMLYSSRFFPELEALMVVPLLFLKMTLLSASTSMLTLAWS